MSTGLRDECRCGHDRSDHFDKTHNCLAMRCECKTFTDPSAPVTKRPPALASKDDDEWSQRMRGRPHNDWRCTCAACLEWLRQEYAPY